VYLVLWLLSILSRVLSIYAYAFSFCCCLENVTDLCSGLNIRFNLGLVGSCFDIVQVEKVHHMSLS
jgi:hypothetical protein